MQMSGDLSELQDEMTALYDEVYDNGCDDGYEEAEKERKPAKSEASCGDDGPEVD
jgi:hypothetical protein